MSTVRFSRQTVDSALWVILDTSLSETTSGFVTKTTTTTIGSLAEQTTTLETTSCEGICGFQWKPFSINGKCQCFKFAGKYQLEQAERACQELSAQLPLPENRKQNKDMLKAFNEMTYGLYNGTYNYYDSRIVLGVNDKENEGKWVKSNGENVTYFNWDENEPNNALDGENYATFRIFPGIWGGGGKWNDNGDLNYYFPVICQRIG